MSKNAGQEVPPLARERSFLRSVKTVAWAFLGLRKRTEYQRDLESINPLHVIVVGILGFLLLILSLVALVHWVV